MRHVIGHGGSVTIGAERSHSDGGSGRHLLSVDGRHGRRRTRSDERQRDFGSSHHSGGDDGNGNGNGVTTTAITTVATTGRLPHDDGDDHSGDDDSGDDHSGDDHSSDDQLR